MWHYHEEMNALLNAGTSEDSFVRKNLENQPLNIKSFDLQRDEFVNGIFTDFVLNLDLLKCLLSVVFFGVKNFIFYSKKFENGNYFF